MGAKELCTNSPSHFERETILQEWGADVSRAGKRVLTVLSYTNASLKVVKRWCADEETKLLVDVAQERCEYTLGVWPVVGDGVATMLAVKRLNEKIGEAIAKLEWTKPNQEFDPTGLCYVSLQMVDDLLQLIANKTRRGWLETMHKLLTDLLEHLDPEGVMFLPMEQASDITNAVYSVVGWE